MEFIQSFPDYRLLPYIRCYWHLEYNLPENETVSVPFGVTGHTHLIFCLKNPFRTSYLQGAELTIATSTLFGQITAPVVKHFKGPSIGVAIDFTPTGLHHLCGVPTTELTGLSYNALDILFKLKTIEEQLLEASTAIQRFAIIDNYMLKMLAYFKPTDGRIETVVKLLQTKPGHYKIGDLANHVNTSERTLNRCFKEKVGVSPKYFACMQRFLHTRRFLESSSKFSWQELISQLGYYDQSHLINEFHHFTGKSPGHYGHNNLHDFMR